MLLRAVIMKDYVGRNYTSIIDKYIPIPIAPTIIQKVTIGGKLSVSGS